MKATLFTTLGCHLCETASLELKKLKKIGKIECIEEVEIANSEKLVEKYGASIPVVKICERELYWPFELQDLETLVKKLK